MSDEETNDFDDASAYTETYMLQMIRMRIPSLFISRENIYQFIIIRVNHAEISEALYFVFIYY